MIKRNRLGLILIVSVILQISEACKRDEPIIDLLDPTGDYRLDIDSLDFIYDDTLYRRPAGTAEGYV